MLCPPIQLWLGTGNMQLHFQSLLGFSGQHVHSCYAAHALNFFTCHLKLILYGSVVHILPQECNKPQLFPASWKSMQPYLTNHVQTIDQAMLKPGQLLKKAFPRSCCLKLLRTLRNGSPRKRLSGLYFIEFWLPSRACLPLLEQLFQMNAQQSLVFVSFISCVSLKCVRFL